ncbi:hypothetical protein C8P68_10145 [Mucilaginibacter yixingensis]|uniref:Cytochrome b561 n=1 Tax=Mucilaginibacter yixingensis TaxID=1295612 RepID=A0A2T5JEF0_9SPHI|nr:cytochrome B [Mucilaginibacter yixingensis]PTR00818.1 hypothetical protein C8P68_10145 [Mucilaginibacter yixingensis]
MYTFLFYFHSGLRFVVLLLLLLSIIQSLTGWLGNKPYTESNRKGNMFTMISMHVQLLVGLALYFVSPLVQFGANTMKQADTRYWTVEHITMMIAAIAIVTIGHSRSKKAATAQAKHKNIAIFYVLAVLVIVAALAGHRPLLAMSR